MGLLTQPAWALKLTDFLEFQQHMQGSPAKNMLVTQPDTTSTICADSLPEQP
ncbi:MULTISPECIES: hypothetical protein [unclassified Methylophilus]|uniref:hypothetical protein n=1 Tax=unclassified Methylophilus TaxID=2630143 RepID=UPI000ABFA3D4|nr:MULTISPECIES: hypothetical protein [unclassified Methylophilus]